MPYSTPTPSENPGMDWKKAFSAFYSGKQHADKKGFLPLLDLRDKFVPDAITQLADADLAALLALSDNIQRLANQNSYYLFYAQLVNKVAALVIESSPEAFDALSASQKETVFGAKLGLPNERAVFNHIYSYTQKRQAMPSGTIDNGATMRSTIERANEEAAADAKTRNLPMVSAKLMDTLCTIDTQYGLYFLDNMKGAQ